VKEFEFTKIDVAVDQLDWAIRLFLDHRAYVPAITLAGAAEEILGKPLARLIRRGLDFGLADVA
jgi:hypothetical protein